MRAKIPFRTPSLFPKTRNKARRNSPPFARLHDASLSGPIILTVRMGNQCGERAESRKSLLRAHGGNSAPVYRSTYNFPLGATNADFLRKSVTDLGRLRRISPVTDTKEDFRRASLPAKDRAPVKTGVFPGADINGAIAFIFAPRNSPRNRTSCREGRIKIRGIKNDRMGGTALAEW